MVGLYPDVETYTNQLRGLEATVRARPTAIPPRFLLAYHYLVEGHTDEAQTEFAEVSKHEPKDQLSASFAKALTKAKESAAATETPSIVHGGSADTAAAPGGIELRPRLRTLRPATAAVPASPASSSAAEPAECSLHRLPLS